MVSSLEMVCEWVRGVLGVRVGTYPPASATTATGGAQPFAVVTRTGGEVDYPHESPAFAVQVWAADEATAETDAYLVAIACKTMPPSDAHVNAILTPTVLSYGRMEGGWFVWQANVSLEVNLLD
ncbi:MAG: hypothetical protein MR611_10510 [Coriobacteriaceae bacterium]|nr:hypothetical protein [Coriobacteriaceae bacterium]